jgi:hypothetical protein
MRIRIPRYLHLPMQILWFDMEDLALISGVYFMWLLIDSIWVLLGGIALVWVFMNTKGKMPRGYLKHLAYSLGFWSSKSLPPSGVAVHHE